MKITFGPNAHLKNDEHIRFGTRPLKAGEEYSVLCSACGNVMAKTKSQECELPNACPHCGETPIKLTD